MSSYTKGPWVFWITIEKRHWFSLFWTTRGANFREFQIMGFRISIGLPWLTVGNSKEYIDYANKINATKSFSILFEGFKKATE